MLLFQPVNELGTLSAIIMTNVENNIAYDSEDDIRYYELINRLIKILHSAGELAVTEVESLALADKLRPTAILDELAMTPGIIISFADGRISWQL